jgi:hypothetical protein
MQQILINLSDDVKKLLVSYNNHYKLPIEVWQMVLLYLSPDDLYNFMFCNKTFLRIVLSDVDSLSLNFINTLHDPEHTFVFKGIGNYNSRLEANVKFIYIMKIFKFANSNVFEQTYKNNNIILSSASNNRIEFDHAKYVIENTQSVTLYNASIRYGLLKVFYPEEFNIDSSSLFLIKFAEINTFHKLFLILLQLPSVLSELNYDNLTFIHNFFSRWQVSFTVEKCIFMIKYVSNFGGHPGKALNHLSYNRYKIYLDSLICGVQEPHANWYASSRTSLAPDLLLTFKSLVPIVGYFYAKYFILDRMYNLDDLPYFVEVASKLNSHNIFSIDKCKTFSLTGGDLDKVLTLRNRKRKFY